MFQSFTPPPAHDGSDHIALLREEMRARGLSGFIVPRADAHMGEYVPPADERLAWLTGFTGSAGFAAVLEEAAALFVDGRYTLQAADQADETTFAIEPLSQEGICAWLAAKAPAGAKIGFDPSLHGAPEIRALEKALKPKGGELITCGQNPLDAAWADRPAPPEAPVRPHDLAHAGESAAEKRARIGEKLREAGADIAVLTLPDSIAWLFNIRGADIQKNPVPLLFALIEADGGAQIFARPGQAADPALSAHLGANVCIAGRSEFSAALAALKGRRVLVDEKTCPLAVISALEAAGASVITGADPCILPKAIKNKAEIAGARAAHLRDGAAICRFLAWLDREAPGGALTEIAIAKRLEAERRKTNALRDISFDTISGSGPNGAIVHYRVTEATDRRLNPGELMLVDSGGQYEDGTTDITRTIAVGEPPAEAVRCNTLVLKGMIAVATARFPKGTTGRDLDTLARAALWRAGLDYDHGTGHGIGAYLCVHEGPQSLSRRGAVALEPGMIVSDEPGYYRRGAFGIRIENLLLTEEARIPEGGERAMLSFETLTLAPVDRRLIDAALLSAEERAWLNAYHQRVLREIGPLLEEEDAAWLSAVCAPL